MTIISLYIDHCVSCDSCMLAADEKAAGILVQLTIIELAVYFKITLLLHALNLLFWNLTNWLIAMPTLIFVLLHYGSYYIVKDVKRIPELKELG